MIAGARGLVGGSTAAYKASYDPDIRDHYTNYFPGALIVRDAGPRCLSHSHRT